MRWSEQPQNPQRKGKLATLWEGWVTENPFHWHETGLRPGRSRWRSKWMWLLGLTLGLRLLFFLVGLGAIIFEKPLAPVVKQMMRHFDPGRWLIPDWFWWALLILAIYGLLHVVAILVPPHLAAKSWQRDREVAWRDHLGVIPVTSQRVIFAKSHLWLLLIFIGKAATIAVTLALLLVSLGKTALTGEWGPSVEWSLMVMARAEETIGQSMALLIPLTVLHWVLGIVNSVIWWLLAFGFLTLFGLQGMSPLVNLTLVGLVLMAIGGVVGFGLAVPFMLLGAFAGGPMAVLVMQMLMTAGQIALLGVGTWLLWRLLPKMVAKHYRLSR